MEQKCDILFGWDCRVAGTLWAQHGHFIMPYDAYRPYAQCQDLDWARRIIVEHLSPASSDIENISYQYSNPC